MDVGGASILYGFCMQLQKDLYGGKKVFWFEVCKAFKKWFLSLVYTNTDPFPQSNVLCFLVQDFGGFCDTFGSA